MHWDHLLLSFQFQTASALYPAGILGRYTQLNAMPVRYRGIHESFWLGSLPLGSDSD